MCLYSVVSVHEINKIVMISLFRNFRNKLLYEGQFRKYLIYAAGEILLIVLGIMIALSINNWNQYSKDRKAEREYLKRIVHDLQLDAAYYIKSINRSQQIMDLHKTFIDEIYNVQASLAETRNLLQDFLNFGVYYLHVNDETIKELMSTGNLSKITNDTVRSAILNYYNSVEQAESHIEEWNNSGANGLDRFWNAVPSLIKIIYEPDIYNEQRVLESEWTFINNPKSNEFKLLERNARTYRSKNRDFIYYYQKLNVQAEELIELILKNIT